LHTLIKIFDDQILPVGFEAIGDTQGT